MMFRARIKPGRGRGRRIGFPTLNLVVPEDFPYPHGIYAGRVWIGEKRHRAAIHYGPLPTFGLPTPTLEAFILDRRIAHPPRSASAELIAYLRPIRRFPNVRALSRQIANDVRKVRHLVV